MRFSCGALFGLLVLSGCGSDDSSSSTTATSFGSVSAPSVCTDETKKQFVWDVLNDSYYWADEMPASISLDDYTDDEALLESLRYQPTDEYSFIISQDTWDAWQSNSAVGVGYSAYLNDDEDAYIIRYVYEDSPGWNAGLRRGHQITAFNEISVSELVEMLDSGEITSTEAFGESAAGVTVQIDWLDTDGVQQSAEVVKAELTTNRVHGQTTIETNQGSVGYLAYTSFTEASEDELTEAFEAFDAEGVDELILDLRYNTGGRVSVATQLASLIAGEVASGETFATYEHNSAYSHEDWQRAFYNPSAALDLSQVIVLTDYNSCSASELVINGLEPFVDVTIIGETTCGKPIGMYQHSYCDQYLYPIDFHIVNALDFGDYFDGIDPDCAVEDDPQYPYGDERDSQTAAALDYLELGSCSSTYSTRDLTEPSERQPVSIYPDWDF